MLLASMLKSCVTTKRESKEWEKRRENYINRIKPNIIYFAAMSTKFCFNDVINSIFCPKTLKLCFFNRKEMEKST